MSRTTTLQPVDIDRLLEAIHSLQRSLVCAICLELITEPTKTRCGHSFCKACILKLLKNHCPLCKESVNRRTISKDDHLQTCIERFNALVAAVQNDSHLDDILSLSHQPRDTKESCCYPDARQSNSDKERSSRNETPTRQLNQNAGGQINRPSTSRETTIDCSNRPRCDFNAPNEKSEPISPSPLVSHGDENDNAIHSLPDIKVRTWIHSMPPDILTADDWIAGDEKPIEDKAKSAKPISDDNGKSDETGEVRHGKIDASRRASRGRKRGTVCPKRIDADDALSQVDKGARQIGEVIEIDSAASGLKYKACHARVRAKESHRIAAGSKSVNQSKSSSPTAASDRVATSAPPRPSTSAIAKQSNWSGMMEFKKEMKRTRKGKMKRLNVSTKKNRDQPRIVENVKLSPSSKFDLSGVSTTSNKSGKATNVSDRLESSDRKRDASDGSLDLSEVTSLNKTSRQTESHNESKNDNQNASFITLEEGRKLRILNLNANQVGKIIGLESAAEDTQRSPNRRCEENVADCRDSPRKRSGVPTPEKREEHVHEIIRVQVPRFSPALVSQTSTGNFRSSSRLPAEKQTPGPRETRDVQGKSSGAASSQFSTPNKGRLSLRRKPEIDGNRGVASPLSSQLPLSYRILIDKRNEDVSGRKSVDSSVHVDGVPFDRLKVVRRDLNFQAIREDQQRSNQNTVSARSGTVEAGDGNVSGIVRQDGKLGRDSAAPRRPVPTGSRGLENQGHQSLVKFMQLGALIRQRNIRYFYLGTTKRGCSLPAECRTTPICNMQQSVSAHEAATSLNPWTDSLNLRGITVVENTGFANNSSSHQAASKEFPALPSICEAPATSTPKRDLNRYKSATLVRSSSANHQSDKSIAEGSRSLREMSRADKSAIHGTIISHTYPGTSNSIKLLSPDKDSQLKFLEIDSPSEREKARRASSIKSAIKGNNFSEMESSRLAASAQEPFTEGSCKKKKRMRCASDRKLFQDGPDDGWSRDSRHSASDGNRTAVKFDKYSKLSEEASSGRLAANKKRRLSSPDNQDVAIPSVSKEQDAPGTKFTMSDSDMESRSATRVDTKTLKRHSGECQWSASITDTAVKKCSTRQDSDGESHRIRNIDEWSDEHDATEKRLTKQGGNCQNSVKPMGSPPEETSAGHQSSRSSNVSRTERSKAAKSSQKSPARESDMFESNSLFNSENLDCILQQQPTKSNADDTSRKRVDSSNDDIINRVLQIDRSRSNPGACRPTVSTSASWNDATGQRERDSGEDLLQDNFNEIMANVEQPQSKNLPGVEQPERNPDRPLARQKTPSYPAMTDESRRATQEAPIMFPSSTNDMFECDSPRNSESPATNAISRDFDKKNVACSQERHGYVSDQRDRRDATANVDAFDKDSRKKIVSKHNVSREMDKSLEERGGSIQSAGRLHVDDDDTQKVTIGNGSNSKDDTLEQDSFMNITLHQARLQLFEEDLLGVAAQNQTDARKTISQEASPREEQRTPKRRRQNTRCRDAEPEEHSADEDDMVEGTPEKKMKSSADDVKTIKLRDRPRASTPNNFLTSVSSTSERTPSTLRLGQIARPRLTDANTPTTPFRMCPAAQSTPMTGHNSIVRPSSRLDVSGGSRRVERVESGSILLAKQVDTRTQQNVSWQPVPQERDLCFVCTGLSQGEVAIVKSFAAKHNANYVNQFDSDVSHVIVKTTGEQNAAKSTLKYLQGIVHRKWIVSFRWVRDCIIEQKLLDEAPYEATTEMEDGISVAGPRTARLCESGLFQDFTFLCVEPYDNVSLDQYQRLLLAAGASLVNTVDVLAERRGVKGIVIQENIHDKKIIHHWCRVTKAADISVQWIVECIGQYKLLKLTPCMTSLSPHELYAIGYPRDLVEEDKDFVDDE
ncbi:PREDICTED: uncharacterized protein LOC105569674 [Vollenhovia emeryi]|uniref:uncharacterized protein LOC105569674 n=1 Tax=Vollenhovia emeryi TaxID=411798 RepID=UPI0005F37FCA|nr:PREDICTED: uncharacterized protein LOC105569674 [Vollenhovia emeryi]